MPSLRLSGTKPHSFHGTIVLPPSKSYLHRALFSASLLTGRKSIISNVGEVFSDDVKATILFLQQIGVALKAVRSQILEVSPSQAYSSHSSHAVDLGGSGTTARFAIAFAALTQAGDRIQLIGNSSLKGRPMQPLLDALSQLGVETQSDHGHIPVTIFGGGLEGGDCVIDGSISSQFISALIIASLKARHDTKIVIRDRSKMVSEPYIDATIRVLEYYGFVISRKHDSSAEFMIKSGQKGRSKRFAIPGDMSSAAALIGATITSSGSLKLAGANLQLPQPDSEMLKIAKEFGARISQGRAAISIDARKLNATKKNMVLDLVKSPDLVPAVFGTAAGIGMGLKVTNVGHLRFKESDRIHTLADQFSRLGLSVTETQDSISATQTPSKSKAEQKPIFLDPQDDHRMLMAFVIAGLSGRFGEFCVRDPSCVNKSYPNFVRDLQSLIANERDILKIVKKDSR